MAPLSRATLLSLAAAAVYMAGAGSRAWASRRAANGCAMTYSRPSYADVAEGGRLTLSDPDKLRGRAHYRVVRFATGQPRAEAGWPLPGSARAAQAPVLLIPGHGGAHEQVRSLGSHASEQGLDLAWYVLDFGEEPTALHAGFVWEQAAFANEVLAKLNAAHGGGGAVVVGHSYGGVVARAAMAMRNHPVGAVRAVVALGAPLVAPALGLDRSVADLYSSVDKTWRAGAERAAARERHEVEEALAEAAAAAEAAVAAAAAADAAEAAAAAAAEAADDELGDADAATNTNTNTNTTNTTLLSRAYAWVFRTTTTTTTTEEAPPRPAGPPRVPSGSAGAVPLLSVSGGARDAMVVPALSAVDGIVPPGVGHHAPAAAITNGFSVDHRALLWCYELLAPVVGAVGAAAKAPNMNVRGAAGSALPAPLTAARDVAASMRAFTEDASASASASSSPGEHWAAAWLAEVVSVPSAQNLVAAWVVVALLMLSVPLRHGLGAPRAVYPSPAVCADPSEHWHAALVVSTLSANGVTLSSGALASASKRLLGPTPQDWAKAGLWATAAAGAVVALAPLAPACEATVADALQGLGDKVPAWASSAVAAGTCRPALAAAAAARKAVLAAVKMATCYWAALGAVRALLAFLESVDRVGVLTVPAARLIEAAASQPAADSPAALAAKAAAAAAAERTVSASAAAKRAAAAAAAAGFDRPPTGVVARVKGACSSVAAAVRGAVGAVKAAGALARSYAGPLAALAGYAALHVRRVGPGNAVEWRVASVADEAALATLAASGAAAALVAVLLLFPSPTSEASKAAQRLTAVLHLAAAPLAAGACAHALATLKAQGSGHPAAAAAMSHAALGGGALGGLADAAAAAACLAHLWRTLRKGALPKPPSLLVEAARRALIAVDTVRDVPVVVDSEGREWSEVLDTLTGEAFLYHEESGASKYCEGGPNAIFELDDDAFSCQVGKDVWLGPMYKVVWDKDDDFKEVWGTGFVPEAGANGAGGGARGGGGGGLLGLDPELEVMLAESPDAHLGVGLAAGAAVLVLWAWNAPHRASIGIALAAAALFWAHGAERNYFPNESKVWSE